MNWKYTRHFISDVDLNQVVVDALSYFVFCVCFCFVLFFSGLAYASETIVVIGILSNLLCLTSFAKAKSVCI